MLRSFKIYCISGPDRSSTAVVFNYLISSLIGQFAQNPFCLLSQAAKIPLSSELGIDEFHFNDFSLDNDAMITASLRMFLELSVVQKFKIDYEVRRGGMEIIFPVVIVILHY